MSAIIKVCPAHTHCNVPSSCRGVAQPGRAPGSGPGGRRFKSSLPDHYFQQLASGTTQPPGFDPGALPDAHKCCTWCLSQGARPSLGKPVFAAAGSDAHLDFKVLTIDTQAGFFLIEHRNVPQGGPVRHLHYAQEEWFYLIEGSKLVIDERFTLRPGDSILA